VGSLGRLVYAGQVGWPLSGPCERTAALREGVPTAAKPKKTTQGGTWVLVEGEGLVRCKACGQTVLLKNWWEHVCSREGVDNDRG
jgi:hypothetical protein